MTKRQSYSKRSDLPVNEIVAHYQGGQSLKQIAESYGTSDNTVKRLLQQEGVQLRTTREAARLKAQSDPEQEARDEEIVRLYGEGASTVTLGRRYRLAPSAVNRILLRNGVTLRTHSAAAHSKQPPLPPETDPALPVDEITAKYKSGASAASLAKAYNVSSVTILGLLRRNDTEVRTKQSLPADEIISRYHSGDSLATLAAHYGVSVKAIRGVMEAHGVARRSPTPQPGTSLSPDTDAEIVRRNRAGESLRSIAASLGISRTAVKGVLDRKSVAPSGPKRGPRPDLPMDEIIKRRAAGESARDLAAEYGTSVATINRRLQKASMADKDSHE